MIHFENVRKTYAGAHGCMCGCKGRYAVASHYGVEAANEEAGWEAHDGCSDRSVRTTVRKLNDLIDWDNPETVEKYVTEDHVWFDTPTRSLMAYLIKPLD